MNMNQKESFSKEIVLLKNVEEVVDEIVQKLANDVLHKLKRFGSVIGISGGIDSSVCLALAVKALGEDKVLGLIMPEQDSNLTSEELALELATKFGVRTIKEILTPALEGFKCYDRRDQAVKQIFPNYDPITHKMKIGIKQQGLYNNLPPLFTLTVIDEKGIHYDQLMRAKEYLQIVAASNFKQRSRMSMLYYHAETLYYAVIGTPNKHEQEQGFFVKYGDGGADVMPIGNLYKTQVYQLGEYLGIPKKILERTPTSDTYSAGQTQEEFFFQLPFKLMDLYWYGFENGYSPTEVAAVMEEKAERVEALYRNFDRKRKTTEYLRMSPIRDYYRS
jgi:NAD+ synthase